MPLPKEQYKYTVDDILALPEGERAELLDGKIYDMAPPTATHQFILFELSLTIGTFIKNNKGSCQVALAPFAVFFIQCTVYFSADGRVVKGHAAALAEQLPGRAQERIDRDVKELREQLQGLDIRGRLARFPAGDGLPCHKDPLRQLLL